MPWKPAFVSLSRAQALAASSLGENSTRPNTVRLDEVARAVSSRCQVAIIHECAATKTAFGCMAPTARAALNKMFPNHDIIDEEVSPDEAWLWLPENASKFHIVVFSGQQYEPTLTEAELYPTTWFLTIDVTAPEDGGASNVIYGTFSEAEVAYAAGYLAGLITHSQVLGVVAGFPFNAVKRLFNGFRLGAEASCPDCIVEGAYVNSFVHYDHAVALADYMVNETGADVVFGCGGNTGSYAIHQSAVGGAFGIGVDSDEFENDIFGPAPDAVRAKLVTSAMKKVDVAIMVGVSLLLESEVGTMPEGVSDGVLLFDYVNGAVGLASCHLACEEIGEAAWEATARLESSLALGAIAINLERDGTIPFPDLERDLQFEPALTTGIYPACRSQHAMAFFASGWKGHLAVFGGTSPAGNSYDDLWLYEVENARWMYTEMGMTMGTRPPALEKACMVGMGSFLLLYGGRYSSKQTSDVYLFREQPDWLGFTDSTAPDIALRWTKVNATSGPSLENAGCAAFNESCVLVFGGRAAFNERKQLYRFCLDSSETAGTWTLLWPPSSALAASGPDAIQGAGTLVVDGPLVGLEDEEDALVVVGGSSSGTLRTEVWCFSLEKSTWSRLPNLPFGLGSRPLLYEESKATNDGGVERILVVQLTSTESSIGMGALVFDALSQKWIPQATTIKDVDGNEVEEVTLATAVRAEGRTWMFGGFVGNGEAVSTLYSASFEVYAECDPGSEADGLECYFCPPGQVSMGGLAATCTNCTGGYYANSSGMSECLPCQTGTFSQAGSETCDSCPAGWTTEFLASAECTHCSPGRFSEAGGSCKACEVGQFNDVHGASACQLCNGSLTTRYPGAESADECICAEGSYRPSEEDQRTDCLACPEGMTCPLGSDWRNLETLEGIRPQVLPGYMTRKSDPSKVFLCMSEEHCPGGDPGSCATLRDPDKVACGSCFPDAFESGEACKTCEDSWGFTPVLVLLLGSAAAIICLAIGVNQDLILQTRNGIDLVVLAGLSISSLQTLGVFSTIAIVWIEPLGDLLRVMTVMSLELEVLQLSCMFSADPVSTYLRAIFPVFFAAVVIFVALRFKKRKHRDVNVFLQFCNAMGSILNILLISILLMTFRPFLCYKHPADSGASLRSYPSVLCDVSTGDFLPMVVAGILDFMLVPMPFLALCIYSTCKYPKKMTQYGGENFLKATGFLFFRFTPSRYYYGLIGMTRSLLVCLVPVVILDEGGFQVLCLTAILIVFSQVQMYLHPWRSHTTNIVDGTQSVILVILLVGSGLTTQLDLDKRAVATCGVVGFTLMLSLVVVAMVKTIDRMLRVDPFYPYFLCHYKADAAAQARYLKMLLDHRRSGGTGAFLDSDHLKDLDQLFDIIKTRVGTLVPYLTRGTLTRPWCCGEITTAHRNNVKALRIVTPSFLPPQDSDLESLQNNIDFSSCSLANYGITIEDTQAALQWLLSHKVGSVELQEGLHGNARFESLLLSISTFEKILREQRGLSDVPGPSLKLRRSPSLKLAAAGTAFVSAAVNNIVNEIDLDGCLLVSTDPSDSEAIAATHILVVKIKSEVFQKLQRETIAMSSLEDCQNDLPTHRRSLAARCAAIVVMLSGGTLTCRVQLQTIAEAVRAQSPAVIPMKMPGFNFPNEDYFTRVLPWRLDMRRGGRSHVKSFFQLIALEFTTHASDQMLTAQCAEVCCRLPRSRRKRSEVDEADLDRSSTSVDLPPLMECDNEGNIEFSDAEPRHASSVEETQEFARTIEESSELLPDTLTQGAIMRSDL